MYTLSHGFSLFNSKENITFTQRTPSGRIKMALLCVSTIQWSEAGDADCEICCTKLCLSLWSFGLITVRLSATPWSLLMAIIMFSCPICKILGRHRYSYRKKTKRMDLTPLASTHLWPTHNPHTPYPIFTYVRGDSWELFRQVRNPV